MTKEYILKTYDLKRTRGFDTITWSIDLHDTVVSSNYTADELPTEFAPYAEEVLQRLSKRDDTVLIMNTCSYPAEIEKYQEFFRSRDIIFKYVNENPEAKNTAFGFFEKKFYFNISLEDKANFDMYKDWIKISKALDHLENPNDGSDLKELEYHIDSYEDNLKYSINKLLSLEDHDTLVSLFDVEFKEEPFRFSLIVDWIIKPKNIDEPNITNWKIVNFLEALSHTDNNMTKLLYFPLMHVINNSDDIEQRELAIKCFENWGDPFGAACLLKTKKDTAKWLHDYKENVASDLVITEINSITDSRFTAVDYLKSKGWDLEDSNGYGLMGKGIADMMEEYYNIKIGKWQN